MKNQDEELPWILEYQVGTTVRMTLPRRPVSYVSSSGNTDACQICPTVPLGCTGWRRAGETDWRPLETLPKEWLPALNRKRGTAMDPRPEAKA